MILNTGILLAPKQTMSISWTQCLGLTRGRAAVASGRRPRAVHPVHPQVVGVGGSAGFSPLRRLDGKKRTGIRFRGGVLKLKRRKRRAPLPTTSGCSAVHGEAKGALAWVEASELFCCGQPVMRRGRGFGGRTTRITVSQNDCQQGLTAAFWP